MDSEMITRQELQDVKADFGACLLAIASALEKAGVISNEKMREAAQERLLTLTVGQPPTQRYAYLTGMATALPRRPDEESIPR